ncbi:MAG: MraY family glycosyltransferase [Bacillota bacterium]|nr:MraY family glycosyltransferase [Bacillota bacterium]
MLLKCIIVFGTALLIALAVTPLCIRLAPKIGAMDVPKDDRRMHQRAMPRLGGLAIFLGSVAATLLWLPVVEEELQPQLLPGPEILGILLGGALMFLMGLVDDIRGLPAKGKLLGQLVCASVVFSFSVRFEFITNPFTGQPTADFPIWVSYLLTVIWIVGISNTINLIDGLDGLAGGISAIATVCIAYTAYIHGSYDVCMALLAVAGGSCGFLPFNFHPARIFMGDCGSLFLGFMLASVSVMSLTKSATVIAVAIPVVVLALPIFDTAFAILRRLLNGRPIMEADKGHLHHRIMRAGMGQTRTVLTMYSISGVMGVAAILVSRDLFVEPIMLTAVAVALIAVFLADQNGKIELKARKISRREDLEAAGQQEEEPASEGPEDREGEQEG